jgi:hypothetical protein
MAINIKIKRKWIKQEKQIVRLLYRKGFLLDYKIDELYWESYKWSKRAKYYLPEIHSSSSDYFGEVNEYPLVDSCLWSIAVDNAPDGWDFEEDGFYISPYSKLSRGNLIKSLKKLPTKINNNKINKILKTLNFFKY